MFHGHFIISFSNVTAPITYCMKKNQLNWTKATSQAFKEIEKMLIEALVLQLPNFPGGVRSGMQCIKYKS